MKCITLFITAAACLSRLAVAQSDASFSASDVPPADRPQVMGPPGDGVYAVTIASPHTRRWERVVPIPNEDGVARFTTNTVEELGSGINRLDENGRFVAADAEIELINGTAVARKTRHRVIFASNLNDQDGTVDVQMGPEGQRFREQIIGLAFTQQETGHSEFFAEIQDSTGTLVDRSKIVYDQAFDSTRASVVYELGLASLECDVLFQEQLPDARQMGFDPQTVRVEIWHQILEAPEPRKEESLIQRITGDADPDQFLDFGPMQIGMGRAFWMDDPSMDERSSAMQERFIRISKEYQRINGLAFLIESVPLAEIAPYLESLPKRQAALNPTSKSKDKFLAQLHSAGRGRAARSTAPKEVIRKEEPLLAKANWARRLPALNADYTLFTSQANMTLLGTTTYILSNQVYLTGTTTMERGCVVKLAPGNQPILHISGPVVTKTSSYGGPITFSGQDDNSVGELITGSTGSPVPGNYGFYALSLESTNNTSLSYLRFNYVWGGITYTSGGTHVLSHSQFGYGRWGITPYGNSDVSLRNALFHHETDMFSQGSSTLRGENVTFHLANSLRSLPSGAQPMYLTNCLIIGVTNIGSFSGSNNYTNSADEPSSFLTVGAGSHYLNSSYRTGGSTNINAQLFVEMKQRTTYAPTLVTTAITNPTTWSPQVARNSGTELGWAYEPLDYLVQSVAVTNTSLVLTNGVAIGTYGAYGLRLHNSAVFISQGTPTAPNRLGHANRVQELATLGSGVTNYHWLESVAGTSARPEIRLIHSDFSAMAGAWDRRYLVYDFGSHPPSVLEIANSYLRGAYFNTEVYYSGTLNVILKNNLFERPWWTFFQNSSNVPPFTLSQYNNLFYKGSVGYYYETNSTSWTAKDNLFLTDSIGGSGTFTCSNNGYGSALPTLNGESSGKTGLVADFQSGPMANWLGYLGGFYYPTSGSSSSLTNLVDTGSRSAPTAGLYHFSTRVDQTKEGNTTVDAGFHYVALDANGNPNDYDGDGVIDVGEDIDGDGLIDSGETSWIDAFRVFITQPKSNSNLP